MIFGEVGHSFGTPFVAKTVKIFYDNEGSMRSFKTGSAHNLS